MLNRSGVTKQTLGIGSQILANVEMQASVGCIVGQSLGIDQTDGKKIAFAGTPISIDPANRAAAAVAAGAKTPAAWAFAITTAFAADEVLTVDGVNYTCKAAESVASKQFAGSTAAEQAASLLKMLASDTYAFSAGVEAGQIIATQKTASSTETAVVVSKTASTGAFSAVTKVASYAEAVGNAMLLHDVDVTNGAANGTALIFGFVNWNLLNSAIQSSVNTGINAYGAVSVLKV